MIAPRRAVIRAIAGHDLLATRELARELDRVLVRFGAAVGEEEDVDVAGHDLGQLGAQACARLGGHERVGVGDLPPGRDGLDHLRIAVADVDAHELAVEVEIAGAIGRVEIDALGAIDRDGIHGSLRRPFIERMLAAQRDDLFRAHVPWRDLDGHLSPPC